MNKLSRRQLARYGADRIEQGAAVKMVAQQLAAELLLTGRTNQVDLLLRDISYELESRQLLAQARVTTRSELTAALRQDITHFIKQSTGVANVEISEQIDPAILGGIKVESSTKSWDETVKHRLEQLRKAVA